MTPDIALDTNILAYGEGVGDDERRNRATEILRAVPRARLVVPAQVLGELFNVLVRNGRARSEAKRTAMEWHANVSVVATTPDCVASAIELAAANQLQIWDAIILAAAASAGCTILLSEDLQHGFTWGGVTVVNPFTHPQHPLLTAARE